jgi:hypothetical protein
VCVWNRVRKRVYAEEHGKDEESERVSAGEGWRMESERERVEKMETVEGRVMEDRERE